MSFTFGCYHQIGLVFSVAASITIVYCLKCMYRRIYGVVVRCWFCHEFTKVPWGNRNCFDCPSCQQYNGFRTDGDYNKDIPAMRYDYMNYSVCSARHRGQKKSQQESTAVLCSTCQRHQSLKVQQLSLFQPMNMANEDAELEIYKARLEKLYALCGNCREVVRQRVQATDMQLLPKYMDWMKKKNSEQFQQTAVKKRSAPLICYLHLQLVLTIVSFLVLLLVTACKCIKLSNVVLVLHSLDFSNYLFGYSLDVLTLACAAFSIINLLLSFKLFRVLITDFMHGVLWFALTDAVFRFLCDNLQSYVTETKLLIIIVCLHAVCGLCNVVRYIGHRRYIYNKVSLASSPLTKLRPIIMSPNTAAAPVVSMDISPPKLNSSADSRDMTLMNTQQRVAVNNDFQSLSSLSRVHLRPSRLSVNSGQSPNVSIKAFRSSNSTQSFAKPFGKLDKDTHSTTVKAAATNEWTPDSAYGTMWNSESVHPPAASSIITSAGQSVLVKPTPKSCFTQLLIGVSIGLNVSIVLHFFILPHFKHLVAMEVP